MISQAIIEAIGRFTKERHWDQYHTPENLAKSICIEAAELLECYQWGPRGRMADDDHAKDELADVLTYCIMLADKLGCDMDDIIMDKLERSARKYPVDEVRDDFDEYRRHHAAGSAAEDD